PSEWGKYHGCPHAPVQPTQPPPPTDPPPAPPQPTAIPVVPTNPPSRNTPIPVVVTPDTPIPCELTTIDDTPADIFDSPNEAGEIIGQIDPNTPNTVYGLQLPTDWYLIDGGWVKFEGVMISGDCGGLVGLTIADSPITVDEFDPATAQSYCLELAELADPVCFYHTLQDDTQVICMMQNAIMNCEMGNGALLAFFQQIFKTELSPVPRIDGLASVTGDGGVELFDDTQAYPDCAELLTQFLAPYLGTDATIPFRLQGDYIVGFLPLDEGSLEEIETPPCQNMTTHATPVVVNGEIVRDFITQQVMTQYEAWIPTGGMM
ncbi:MAG TPA: hypothetical protein PLZ51_20130, partial [Aggregatilineales bacterium]|nr:hypothetical protein [Aggregatilineales bacterium]